MKTKVADSIRAKLIKSLMDSFSDEDCGMIASNSFNFPIVCDGEEGWVEVVVKVPKYDGDEGYGLREDYEIKLAEKKAKAEKAKAEKEKKIAKDKARRESKKLEKGKEA